MKNKSISTLTLLTLTILIAFIPAVNAYPSEYLDEQTYDTAGIAEWTTAAAHTGDWSVLLSHDAPTGSQQVGSGLVIVPYSSTLDSITGLSFWYNLKSGNPGTNENSAPYMILELDSGGGSTTDLWLVHHMVEISTPNTWLQWQLSDVIDSGDMYGETNMWHAFPGDVDYADLAAVKTAYPNADVVRIKVAVGEWTSSVKTEYYVDDIAVNPDFPLEPIVLDSESYSLGISDTVTVTVADIYENDNPAVAETVTVRATSDSDPVGFDVTLTETGVDTGVFTGSFPLVPTDPTPGAGELGVIKGDTIYVIYGEYAEGVEGETKFTDTGLIVGPVGGTIIKPANNLRIVTLALSIIGFAVAAPLLLKMLKRRRIRIG